jgi:hypothetical protein
MSRKDADPAAIAQVLTVDAGVVLEGKFNPGAYPHQHLAVQGTNRFGLPSDVVPYVMAAVETLGRAGWELVSFGQIGDRSVCAVMRRR